MLIRIKNLPAFSRMHGLAQIQVFPAFSSFFNYTVCRICQNFLETSCSHLIKRADQKYSFPAFSRSFQFLPHNFSYRVLAFGSLILLKQMISKNNCNWNSSILIFILIRSKNYHQIYQKPQKTSLFSANTFNSKTGLIWIVQNIHHNLH